MVGFLWPQGARLFNAAIASGRDAASIANHFDSVSVCLSKGLGAPIGSFLVGPRDLVERARRIRKMLGGGMRQTGVLAAAGLFALNHNVARLAEDHARAERLAETLAAYPELGSGSAHTNMVFMSPTSIELPAFIAYMARRGIGVGGGLRNDPMGDASRCR